MFSIIVYYGINGVVIIYNILFITTIYALFP